jgi:ketosteroid isomerase-like protein
MLPPLDNVNDTPGMSLADDPGTAAVAENLALLRRYLRAVEDGATGEALAAFYTADAVQEELPNRLTPQGAQRDLRLILAAAERGQRALSAQRFEVLTEVATADRVAVEVQWTGTVAAPIGTLEVGGQLRARFAMFLDIREGRIARQRNYDCFYPL